MDCRIAARGNNVDLADDLGAQARVPVKCTGHFTRPQLVLPASVDDQCFHRRQLQRFAAKRFGLQQASGNAELLICSKMSAFNRSRDTNRDKENQGYITCSVPNPHLTVETAQPSTRSHGHSNVWKSQ